MKIRALLLALPLLPVVASAQTFGAASGYSVFTSGNLTTNGGQYGGSLYAGGDFSSSNTALTNVYAQGVASPNSGNATSIVYTGGYTGSSYIPHTQGASPINYAQTVSTLNTLSSGWGGLTTTTGATAGLVYSTYTFAGTGAGLNVFNVSASDLAGNSNFKLSIPSGASALINVTGTSLTLNNGGREGFGGGNVIWNFVDATSLTLNNQVGTVLAPKAALTVNSSLTGQVFAASFQGNNLGVGTPSYYSGATPQAVPEPGTMAVLGLGVLGMVRRRRAAKK
jgi:choice-of-anchor A domain-containing protein